MVKTNKYNYLYILQGFYYGKWEDLTTTNKKDINAYKEIKADKKAYQENEGGLYRIIERRELKEI